jgi:GT2 family glycosyltransferase
LADERPLVTVLTPAYNLGKFVLETVESVLAQGYPRLQYIVLDDGSTDDTLARLAARRSSIELVSHANMGESRTVNRGFELAKGELVCVVNADDPLRPDAINKVVAAYRRHPDALVFYPDWDEIDENSNVVRQVRLPDFDLSTMLRSFNIGMGPGVFITRRALEIVGPRNPELRYTGDLDYWFRVALRGRMVHLPEVLATHRVHAAAASSAHRGETMAREVVGLAERCCSDGLLAPEIRRHRGSILARAHFAASYHAATLAARASYLVRALTLSPLAFAGMVVRRLRYRVGMLRHG